MEHEGNTQGSEEEVAIIKELVRELVGRKVTDVQGHVCKQLGLEDILFVAPYNLQVRKLSAALGLQARVGSVDKFQGQEAPVVIISCVVAMVRVLLEGRICLEQASTQCGAVTGTEPGYRGWESAFGDLAVPLLRK